MILFIDIFDNISTLNKPDTFHTIVYVPDTVKSLSKTVKELDVETPKIQKTTEEGSLLFFDIDDGANIIEVTNPYREIETRKPVVDEDMSEFTVSDLSTVDMIKYDIVEYDEETSLYTLKRKTVDITVEYEKLEPVMIDNMVDVTYTFTERPDLFDINDILTVKYKELLEESDLDLIVGDMFVNEDDIDLEDKDHSANTGKMVLQLLPKGQCKTKTIQLEKKSKVFELLEFNSDGDVDVYINNTKFIDNKLELKKAVDSCVIKFVNTTDSYRAVRSYAIGYMEVE